MKNFHQLHNDNIQKLQKRMSELKRRYKQLTKRIEAERQISSNEDGAVDYQGLLDEKELVEKYIRRIDRQIEHEIADEITERKDNSSIEPGVNVLVVNDTHKLKFQLVKQIIAGIQNQISIESPLGKAVLGKRVGDDIKVRTPNGIIDYRIQEIS
jgi:transcription elongation factor GreA